MLAFSSLLLLSVAVIVPSIHCISSASDVKDAIESLQSTVSRRSKSIEEASKVLEELDHIDREYCGGKLMESPIKTIPTKKKGKPHRIDINKNSTVFMEFVKHKGQYLFLNEPDDSAENIKLLFKIQTKKSSSLFQQYKKMKHLKKIEKIVAQLKNTDIDLVKVIESYIEHVEGLDVETIKKSWLSAFSKRAKLPPHHFTEFWIKLHYEGKLEFPGLLEALQAENLDDVLNEGNPFCLNSDLLEMPLESPQTDRRTYLRLDKLLTIKKINFASLGNKANLKVLHEGWPILKPHLVLFHQSSHILLQKRYVDCPNCTLKAGSGKQYSLRIIPWSADYMKTFQITELIEVYEAIINQLQVKIE